MGVLQIVSDQSNQGNKYSHATDMKENGNRQ
jgi:hypothetical protein